MSLRSDVDAVTTAVAIREGLTPIGHHHYDVLLEAFGITADVTLDRVSPPGQLALAYMANADQTVVAGLVELAAMRPRRIRTGEPSWKRGLEPALKVVTP